MKFWQKIKRVIFPWTKKKVIVVGIPTQDQVPEQDQVQVPPNVVTPTTGGNVVDRVNDGTARNPDHTFLFWNLEFDTERISEIKWYAQQYLKNKVRYRFVSEKTGVPDWFIFLLHVRECSLSFDKVLHNGQKIIGTGKTTTWVPKGRGPFHSWESAAVDALQLKNYHKITDWSLKNILPKLEAWNGLGYRSKIGDRGEVEYSPFIVAGSDFHDETSKYVSDGKYSKTAPEKQLGVFVILRGLMEFADLRFVDEAAA